MRPQEKKVLLYGAGGIALGILIDILIQRNKMIKDNNSFEWDRLNWQEILKFAAIGGVIGSAIGYIIHEFQREERAKKPFIPKQYLSSILAQTDFNEDDIIRLIISNKVSKIIDSLNIKFKQKLIENPFIHGSLAKGTAIKNNHDIDIACIFRKTSYRTLEEMYDELYDYFYNHFEDTDLLQVRKQSKSIGLIFKIANDEICIDVVPSRENANTKKNGESYLFVKPKTIFHNASYKKTNIASQLKGIQNRDKVQTIVKLLKVWRDRSNLSFKSIIIERLVLKTFSSKGLSMPKSLQGQLLTCMEFIGKRIESIRLVDPGNSNNILSEMMTDIEKYEIASLILKDYDKCKADPTHLTEIFGKISIK